MSAILVCSAAGRSEAIDVYPSNTTIEAGSSRQFMAYVPMTPNTVEWLVNDAVGGSDTFGKISPTGAYVAPATVPMANTIVIKARSTANANAFGTVTTSITRKYPWLWSTSPVSVSVGAFQITLNGANFASDSQVLINGSPVTTTYVSPTTLKASSTATSVGTLQVSVRQPGAGSITGNSVALSVIAAPVVVKVSPAAASVQLGNTQSFTSTVTGTSNTAVSWSIASGGGSINNTTGLYTAPTIMPASTAVTVRATSVTSPSSFANATITLIAPPPPPVVVTISPSSTQVQLCGSTTFTSTVTGTSNTAVTWSITSGGGSINATTGVYTAPTTMPASPTVGIRATSVFKTTSTATATLKLVPPPPAIVSLHNARFLEQSSFGPSPATLAEVQQKGIEQFLADQFEMEETPIPTPPNNSQGELRTWALYNYTTAPDQLRQRVAYALSQIIVTSSNKLIYPDAQLPWLRLLSSHAFGSYRELLRDVTVSSSMGMYLDLAFSAKASISGAANENYARELMQLFTIGLWELEMDGSLRPDANGHAIPTYNQETVAEVARALTGWVYANNAYLYFGAPMVPAPNRHDTGSKSILDWQFPAGQTVEQDLDMVIDRLMSHPNIAPFIATRLIRSLVTSNPSPEYIERVATVFASTDGDLKAVITAILLDTEARDDVPQVNSGRLKEPILHYAGFIRALGGQLNSGHSLSYLFEYVAQGVLEPASVFSWFTPLYRLPGDPTLFGPEFQIYSPTDCSLRGNYFYGVLNSPGTDVIVDLTPFMPYGHDMPGLVEAANQALLYGRMPAAMKQVIINAAAPGYDAKTRVITALYLTALSGQYAVQH